MAASRQAGNLQMQKRGINITTCKDEFAYLQICVPETTTFLNKQNKWSTNTIKTKVLAPEFGSSPDNHRNALGLIPFINFLKGNL